MDHNGRCLELHAEMDTRLKDKVYKRIVADFLRCLEKPYRQFSKLYKKLEELKKF